MSSISLPLKMLIAGTAFAGLTMLACGGDDSGKGADNTDDSGKKTSDSGTKKSDAGDAGKKADSSVLSNIPSAEPGDDCDPSDTSTLGLALCTGCGVSYCTTKCGEDGTYGECQNPAKAFGGGDAGNPLGNLLGDGGNFSIHDGSVSVKVGDASVDIPATACPDSLTCNNIGSAIGVPLSYCTASGALAPPDCTSQQDCTSMGFKTAACAAVPSPLSILLSGMYCLQICK